MGRTYRAKCRNWILKEDVMNWGDFKNSVESQYISDKTEIITASCTFQFGETVIEITEKNATLKFIPRFDESIRDLFEIDTSPIKEMTDDHLIVHVISSLRVNTRPSGYGLMAELMKRVIRNYSHKLTIDNSEGIK
jgi:hypothetical protein